MRMSATRDTALFLVARDVTRQIVGPLPWYRGWFFPKRAIKRHNERIASDASMLYESIKQVMNAQVRKELEDGE